MSSLLDARYVVRSSVDRARKTRGGTAVVAASARSVNASTRVVGDESTTRRGLLGGIVGVPIALHARAALASAEYIEDTLAVLDACERLADGRGSDVDDAFVKAWYGRNKTRYSQSEQGRSFLMTSKVVALVRGGNVDSRKLAEWVPLARGLTNGTITGRAAREAYGSAVWANNDKTDAKNRIGLCIFGATAPTQAMGIDCSGF
ncbi:unnamed product [Ostreococcus tauri]|uniref:Unnamed product n=1 Tax=Ostreococcus tauri TaxID=70448 RepID=A0A090M2G6_OSTTA|nr:unnamed product [Ostreococcus tauri]CEF98425.1 unnamed product [Ostreococcus tauri]|eukprot:XP_022839255.1 unnamed product [Ostreococcus tauri]